MTSGTPFPHNLTEIDPLTRPDHYYLDPDDECYFLGEYTARQGYAYSATNDLILNLKKTPDRRGRPEWRHKERAIVVAARALKNAFMRSWLRSATFVPIPPSKARNDPIYDDRMSRLIQAIDTNRPGPTEIRALYALDPELMNPTPSHIAICDDVLTTGAHFKAAQDILSEAFPGIQIVGCFIARRVPEAVDIESFFNELGDG